jgi:hypothetical protein
MLRSRNAGPRCDASNAAKPAKQTRPAFENVVQRGRAVGATPQSRAMPDAIAARARLFTSDLFMPWGRPR